MSHPVRAIPAAMTRPNARPVISNLPRLRVAKRRPGGFRIGCAGAILAKQLLHDDEERSEEHTSELQSLMRISYAVFCLKKKNKTTNTHNSSNFEENTK